MRRFSTLTLLLTITLVISACGANPTPTASPIDLQGTVAAAAFTVVAQTQAAIPTATPPPPTPTSTDTPAPTSTFPPLPGSQITLTPVSNANSGGTGGDPCINKVMPSKLQGQPVKIRINNSTKVSLAVSIYLNQATDQSQCGYRTYTIESQQSIVLGDLVEGCYTLWAWNPDPKGYFIVTNGTTCVDTSEAWVFDISTGSIKLKS